MNIENEIDIEDSLSTYVSLAEIAEELGASRSAVRSWLASGSVEAYTFGCGRNAAIRYERVQVEAWIESCGSDFQPEEEDELEEDELEEDESADFEELYEREDDGQNQEDSEENPEPGSDDDWEDLDRDDACGWEHEPEVEEAEQADSKVW